MSTRALPRSDPRARARRVTKSVCRVSTELSANNNPHFASCAQYEIVEAPFTMAPKQSVAAQNGSADNFVEDASPYKEIVQQVQAMAHSAWESDQKDETISKLSEQKAVLEAELSFFKQRLDRVTISRQELRDEYLNEYSQHMRYNAQKEILKKKMPEDKYNELHGQVQGIAEKRTNKKEAKLNADETTRLELEQGKEAEHKAVVQAIRDKYKQKRSSGSSTRPLSSAIAKKPTGGKGKAATKKPDDDDAPKKKSPYQNFCQHHMPEFQARAAAAKEKGEEFTAKWPTWIAPMWHALSEEEQAKWATPPGEAEGAASANAAAKPGKGASKTAAKPGKGAGKPAAKPGKGAGKPAPAPAKKSAKPKDDEEEEPAKKKAKQPLFAPPKPTAPQADEDDPFAGTDLAATEVEGAEVVDDDQVKPASDEEGSEADEDEGPPENTAKDKAAEEANDDDEDEDYDDDDEPAKMKTKTLGSASKAEVEALGPSDDEKEKEDDEQSKSSDS